ncbi:MAG TPA: prepilin-type N-terminal cleavage/methylation domain-containing protein [Chthoniobacteraceae bacterium]|nr:prepilin-type N-terminal cleavage/methylation domain-containing protein [Chthoniobacteraceae bacterium]
MGTRDRRSDGAFTVVEALVVLVITALLIGGVFVALGFISEEAKLIKCTQNLRQLGIGLNMYANENSDLYPLTYGRSGRQRTWCDALNPYINLPPLDPANKSKTRYWNSPLWWCPSARIIDNDKNYRHYGLNSQITETQWDFRRANVPRLSRYILVGEINANNEAAYGKSPPAYDEETISTHRISHRKGRGANYLFCDGHVEYREGPQTDYQSLTSPWKWW